MYKDKPLIINILLAIWQLPQIILGLLMLLIFRNKTTYTNPYNHITVWNINSGRMFGTACFSTGPIIVTCDGASERTLRHETGHSYDSIRFGFFYHFIVSIPSICLFWFKKIKHKDSAWYYSHFPENRAEKYGYTTLP